MSDFCVLHLSDLHIKGKKLTKTLNNLLDDIKNEIELLNNIVVVVSGDLIDKGDYKNKDGVLEFFHKLHIILGEKFADIQIVPGNHDKLRDISSNLASMALQSHNVVGSYEEWNTIINSYTPFIDLVNSIYKIFGKRKKIKKTFGVESLNINNSDICFIRIDSSWISYGAPSELHSLLIGEYQREQLISEYQKLTNDVPFSLTIAIVHHPISFLKPLEEDKIKECLIDSEYLNVDYLMCGHTHERSINNWFNHDRSVTTLITGIGWDHNKPAGTDLSKKEEHRYSLYIFNQDSNTFELIMRKTQVNGMFDFDYSVYTSKTDKMLYPLRFRQEHPFLPLNSAKEDKRLFLDSDTISYMKKISLIISEYTVKCMHICEKYKHDYLARLTDFLDPQLEEFSIVYGNLYDRFFQHETDLTMKDDPIFMKNPTSIYEQFTTYLQDITINFIASFSPYFECIDKGVIIRAHFRLYDDENDNYYQICSDSNIEPNVEKPRVMEWGGLLKKSFENKCAMVYSNNIESNTLNPIKWDDFLTLVPRFYKYKIYKRSKDDGSYTRPILTFGFSIKSSLDDNSNDRKRVLSTQLYLMEFLSIDAYLAKIIDEFIKFFTVDYSKFYEYKKYREINEENKSILREESL